MEIESPRRDSVRSERGFLDPRGVKTFAFWTIVLCILVSVGASLLAIWDYAKPDVLWRTVATCVVIGAGTALFAVLNRWFGSRD
jgi:hypothetical protein